MANAVNKVPHISAGIALFGEEVSYMVAHGIQDSEKRPEIAYLDSGNDKWTVVEFGEPGEYVTQLANRDNVVFAGTSFGNIYKSTDIGESWELVLSGMLDECLSLIVSPFANDIYASDDKKGIVSRDGGKTWEKLEINWNG